MTGPGPTYSEPVPPAPALVDLWRRRLADTAHALAEAGMPAELIVQTARDGIAAAVDRRQRSGR